MIYCENDVKVTADLHSAFREFELMDKIEKIHAKMDNCDDSAMRAHLARKCNRLKTAWSNFVFPAK